MAHKKHDYRKVCEGLGYEYRSECSKYVELVSEIGTLHKMTKSALIKGGKAKIISVIVSKEEYFIKDLTSRYPNILSIISLNEFEYKGSLEDTYVECLKHGRYKTKPSYLLQGGNLCLTCDNEHKVERNKISNEEFIRRCKNRHGDKYSYEKTRYTGFKNKVVVTCKQHGDF
jgi:hypothetical protein